MLDVLVILLLSFIPMLIYAFALWGLDRYEKEPLLLILLAFGWGAIPSIVLALIMQTVLDVPIVAISPNQLTYDLLGSSVIAPLTEEGVKAVALIALLLLFRKEIDSPIDGLIYGGLVGFGFAAVENLFYLYGAYSEGGLGGVFGLAFLRAGVFGLNHAMYTGFTGLGVALALEMRSRYLRPVPVLIGLGIAMATHALHNALATFTSVTGAAMLFMAIFADWFGVLVLLAVALVAFFLERQRIAAYAETLVRSHRIPQAELEVLTSTFRRRMARLNYLLSGNFTKWQTTNRYHRKVTEAAFAWHRLSHGDLQSQPRLLQLEQEYMSLRGQLVSGNEIAVK